MNLEGLPIRHTLRDGTQIMIRPMETSDGPAILDFYRSLPEEDRLFLRDDVTREEWLDRFLKSIDYDTVLPILAESEGNIVANATLYRSRQGWTVHVGQIRVAVARAFQRKGLGTVLARELVRLAMSFGLEKIVAEVVENQIGARRAFEKLGFHPEAVLKGHVKDIHGIRRDLVLLASDVSHIWEAMAHMVSDYSPSRD